MKMVECLGLPYVLVLDLDGLKGHLSSIITVRTHSLNSTSDWDAFQSHVLQNLDCFKKVRCHDIAAEQQATVTAYQDPGSSSYMGSNCSCSLNKRNSLPLRASQPTSNNIVGLKTRIDELSEFWANQMASDDLAKILKNLPVELKHTGLWISTSQVEMSSQMPCIGIVNVMDAAMSELGSMEGDVVGGMTEDVPDTHHTQSPL